MKRVILISPEGREYPLLAWGICMANSWEWYAFEISERDKDDTIYFGYVMGFENEWGSFSAAELRSVGVELYTSYKDLNAIEPPFGWSKKA